jgi:hypothetical protein
MLFKIVPGGFADIINWNNSNSNWKKLLGYRNMQEKLENKNACLEKNSTHCIVKGLFKGLDILTQIHSFIQTFLST